MGVRRAVAVPVDVAWVQGVVVSDGLGVGLAAARVSEPAARAVRDVSALAHAAPVETLARLVGRSLAGFSVQVGRYISEPALLGACRNPLVLPGASSGRQLSRIASAVAAAAS